MASPVKAMIDKIEKAGGQFIRVTGKGHRRYRIGVVYIDVPLKGLDSGRMRANLESQIKKAARAAGTVEEPREREDATAAPVDVGTPPLSEAAAGTEGDRQGDTSRDGEAGYVDDRRADHVGGGDASRPEPEGPGVVEAVAADQRGEDQGEARSASQSPYVCEVCGAGFQYPMNLGRHKSVKHGPRPILTAPKPEPKAPVVPSSVTSTDLLTRAVDAIEAALAAVQDLATEVRLQRDENARLRALVDDMERAFSVIKAKPR